MTTILAIDDHPFFLIALTRLLCELGKHQVATAVSACTALERLRQEDFDLVLIDISLPDCNGLDLLREIRELKPELPCVMLSGYSSRRYAQEALQAGARGYVRKEDTCGLLEGIQVVLAGGIFQSSALGVV